MNREIAPAATRFLRTCKIFQKIYCTVNRLCYSLRPFRLKNGRASKDREPITDLEYFGAGMMVCQLHELLLTGIIKFLCQSKHLDR